MNVEVMDEYKLETLLSSLTLDQLKNIRRNLQLKNMSSLRKNELIIALAENIPLTVEQRSLLMDVDQYTAILKVMAKSGVIEVQELEIEDIFYLSSIGYVHPAQQEEKDVLIMPNEVMKQFYALDASKIKMWVNRNQKITNLLFVMMRDYGVIKLADAKAIIEKHINEELDAKWFASYVAHLEQYYNAFHIGAGKKYIINDEIEDEASIIEQQEKHDQLMYRPYSQEIVMNMNRRDRFHRTPELADFISYVQQTYQLSVEEIEEIVAHCMNMHQVESTLTDIVSYVGEIISFPDVEDLKPFVMKLVDVLNNSRLWVLKGYTPKELSPAQENAESTKQTPVVNSEKIGRNEPCPCGSGRKYKKCCGK